MRFYEAINRFTTEPIVMKPMEKKQNKKKTKKLFSMLCKWVHLDEEKCILPARALDSKWIFKSDLM